MWWCLDWSCFFKEGVCYFATCLANIICDLCISFFYLFFAFLVLGVDSINIFCFFNKKIFIHIYNVMYRWACIGGLGLELVSLSQRCELRFEWLKVVLIFRACLVSLLIFSLKEKLDQTITFNTIKHYHHFLFLPISIAFLCQ